MNLASARSLVRDADDESVSWAFDGSSSRPNQNGTLAEEKFFCVDYVAEQAVEVRYLGDALWLPAMVLEDVDHDQPDLVRLRVKLNLETNPKMAAKRSSSKQLVVDTDGPEVVSTRPGEVIEVSDDVYSPSCFVRPLVPPAHVKATSHRLVVDDGAVAAHAARQPVFYDAGAYLRGDYVEVRIYDAEQADTLYRWKRGRVSLDRKNGTFDVRLESGADYVGVRGCHLRHHFRPRDVVDCRMPPVAPAGMLSGGEEESAADADGEGGLSSPSEDARADPVGAQLARQHSHGKHSHHHHRHHRHHHKNKHHKHGHHHHGDEDESPLPLHLLPKPLPCVWRPAVVLKQEKSGLYTVSLQDGDKEKGIEPCRLMPSNRAAVRAAAEEVRVLAQTWSSMEQHKRTHKHAHHHKHNRNAEPEPAQAHSPHASARIAPPVELMAADAASSSSAAPSPSKVRRHRTDTDLFEEEGPSHAAVHFPAVVPTSSVAASETSQSAKRAVPAASLFDINDRVEVDHGRLDGEPLWLAGRVEAADLERGTYIVRYADSSADTAVPAARMRRLSISSPKAGNGSGASPRPWGAGSESEPDTAVASKRTGSRKGSSSSSKERSGSRKGSSSSSKERSASPRASPRAEDNRPHRNHLTSEKNSAPGPPSAAPLAPPTRFPVVPPVLSVGVWLSVFNVALGAYEPCVVEAVHEDGTFDARNRRGEAYLRIDHRYVETGPETAIPSNAHPSSQNSGPASPVLRAPLFPSDEATPGEFFATPMRFDGSANQSVGGNGTFAAISGTTNAHSPRLHRVGDRVLAPSASGKRESAVVVRKLAPEIYTVYLEGVGEEATFVAGDLRPVEYESAFASNGGWAADGLVPVTPAEPAEFEEAGERSLVSSLDDDSLVVFGSSIPAPAAVLDPALALDLAGGDFVPDPERALQATRPSTEPRSQRSIRSTAHLRSSSTAEKADRTTTPKRQAAAKVASEVPSAEKPVSAKALRGSGTASTTDSVPPLSGPSLVPASPACTVHFRTSCAPGQAVPIIACISGDVDWADGTCVQVVFRSQRAAFATKRRSATSTIRLQPRNGSQSPANACAIVFASVDIGARHACHISVSFYLGMLVIGELTIQVGSEGPVGWHGRSAERADPAAWACTTCPLRTSHLLFLCSLPQSSALVQDILLCAAADSGQLLPNGWSVHTVAARDAYSLSWEEVSAAQSKVQIVLVPRKGLDREEWLATLRTVPLCERLVRAGLASVCAYESRSGHILESSEFGWLDSFALSPLDLHTGGMVGQRLWVCGGESAEVDQSCSLRQRFVRGVFVVQEEMHKFSANSALVGNLLVLPDSLFQAALREPPQHNEDGPPSYRAPGADGTWSVCMVCDRPQLPGPSSGIHVDAAVPVAEVDRKALSAMLASTKAAVALAVACCAADNNSFPLCSDQGTAVAVVLSRLGLDTLLSLHHRLSHLLAQLQLNLLVGPKGTTFAAAMPVRSAVTKVSPAEVLSESVRILEDAALSLRECDPRDWAATIAHVTPPLCVSASPIVLVSIGQTTLCMGQDDARAVLGPGYEQLSRLPTDSTGLEQFALDPDHLPSVLTPQRAGTTARLVEEERGSPQRRLSPEKSAVQSALGRLISKEVGVKDPFCADEAADCLLAMGCGSEEDFVSVGELFASQEAGGVDADKLRAFFHEGGIPLFIAAKLAVYVRAKLATGRREGR